MTWVYSTLTNDVAYADYDQGGNDMNVMRETVLIKGGTNVASKKLVTPMGVGTEVTEAQLALLEKNPVFQKHVAGGFVKVLARKSEPEKVAANMVTRDKSAPLVPEDFTTDKGPKPVVGKSSKAA